MCDWKKTSYILPGVDSAGISEYVEVYLHHEERYDIARLELKDPMPMWINMFCNYQLNEVAAWKYIDKYEEVI